MAIQNYKPLLCSLTKIGNNLKTPPFPPKGQELDIVEPVVPIINDPIAMTHLIPSLIPVVFPIISGSISHDLDD
jgi:hypothetical protein